MSNPKNVPIFDSLRIPNYRLFWTGSFISNVGTWIARVAQGWLVLTVLAPGSPILPSTALGFVTALQFLPFLLTIPWTGVVADRFPKWKTMQVTQSLMMVTSLVFWLLVFVGQIQLWHVFLLAFIQGVAAAFDTPVRQAIAPEIVPAHLIPNAVGLNTTSFNIARLIGPAVAGIMIDRWGIGPAMLANTISFIPVILAITLMDVSKLTPAPITRAKGAMRDGFNYVRRRYDIVVLLVIVFVIGSFGMNFQITNAIAADHIFHVGAEQFGYLNSIMAVGSVTAGLLAARRTKVRLRIILGAFAGFALAMGLLTIAPSYWFYAVVMAPTGLFALTVMTGCNASVQMATEPRMRGRVMALYMAIFHGGTPFGAALTGWIGDVLGPRATLGLGAVTSAITVLGIFIFIVRRNGWSLPRIRNKEDGVPPVDLQDPR